MSTPCQLVVVAYGAPDLLRRALTAAGPGGLVVDNSSSSEVAAVVTHAHWHYVDPGVNLGFAAAVNVALAWTRAEHADHAHPADVLLLNPDAIIGADSIDALREVLHSQQRCAAVAPSLRAPGGRTEQTLWPVPSPGSTWLSSFGLSRASGMHFLSGAVLLLKGTALDEVGGFDERFFLYAEECDWQVRAQRSGWTVTHVEEVWAEHVGGGTSSDPRLRLRHFHASGEIFARKWHGVLGWQLWRMASLVGAVRRSLTRDRARRAEQLYVTSLLIRGPVRVRRQAE